MGSFVTNVNVLAENVDSITKAVAVFDDEAIGVLQQSLSSSLADVATEVKKGTYLGNKKLDINLIDNLADYSNDMSDDEKEAIWNDSNNYVYYDGYDCLFTDGAVVHTDLTANPIRTNSELLLALSNDTIFLNTLNNTVMVGVSDPVVNEYIRFYDIVPATSNLMRIELHVASGNAKNTTAKYYWGKSTNGISVLATNIADIKLVSSSIQEMQIVSQNIGNVNAVGSNIANVNTTATHINNVDITANHIDNVDITAAHASAVDTVATNVNDVVTTAQHIDNVDTTANHIDNIDTTATSIANVDTVATNIVDVNTVGANVTDVNTVATSVTNVNTVATNIADVNTVADGLADVHTFASTYYGGLDTAPTLTTHPTLSAGDMYFNTTTNRFEGYDGNVWIPLTSDPIPVVLSKMNISNMTYDSDNNLSRIDYEGSGNYELFTYDSDGVLTSIDHYKDDILAGTTTLSYTDGNLVSVVFNEA
jgi:hypothetical protein